MPGTAHERSLVEEAERLGAKRLPDADAEGWQEETARFIDFVEVGDSVSGVLIGREDVPFDDERGAQGQRMVARWTVRTETEAIAFLGGIQLDPVLGRLPFGTVVKVEYTGRTETKGGYLVKGFRVWSHPTKPAQAEGS